MSTYKIHNRSVNHDNCPVVEASKYIADFWNMWILRVLLTGPKRFSELKLEMPSINKVTLVNKLKILISAGFVTKTLDDDLKIKYELTKSGKKVEPILVELEKFARAYSK